jgi:hypothetical protein
MTMRVIRTIAELKEDLKNAIDREDSRMKAAERGAIKQTRTQQRLEVAGARRSKQAYEDALNMVETFERQSKEGD